MRLPAVAAPPPPAPTARDTGAAPARRVLVVEDNDDAREMLAVLLRLGGHEVHEARDGVAAIDAARAVHPDVALIDVGLPGLDGYEVARRLRESPNHARPLLVAVTGYGLPEDRQRSQEAGFDLHLVKPVTPEALRHALAQRPA